MEISRNHLARALAIIDSRYRLNGVRQLSGRALLVVVSAGDGASERLIALSHSVADRKRNPDIARAEYRLLATLRRAGLAVAQPLHLAVDHEPPYFITSFIAGAPRYSAQDGPAFCRRLAALLTEVHALDPDAVDLSYLPRQGDPLAEYLDSTCAADERIRAAMWRAANSVEPNASVLLHGDFWLGNLLWQGEALSGIIDWEDAMLGDPLGDLGKSRLEMLWALGEAAMREYSDAYLALNPQLDAGALPFWDLWGAARLPHFASFAADAAKAADMRRQYERFVKSAIDALDAGQE
ncbi:MAG: phosphotransferase [Chloroflexi bacterium]|nr:phosphotransferase [Chloroflexota bacterium]